MILLFPSCCSSDQSRLLGQLFLLKWGRLLMKLLLFGWVWAVWGYHSWNMGILLV